MTSNSRLNILLSKRNQHVLAWSLLLLLLQYQRRIRVGAQLSKYEGIEASAPRSKTYIRARCADTMPFDELR